MKMTIVTEEGRLTGAMYGAFEPDVSATPEQDSEPIFRAGLMAGPGQELHILDVPERVMRISDPNELHKVLEEEVRDAVTRYP